LAKKLGCNKRTILNYRKKLTDFNFITDTFNHGWQNNFDLLLNPDFFVSQNTLDEEIQTIDHINQNDLVVQNLESENFFFDCEKTSLESKKHEFLPFYNAFFAPFYFLFKNNTKNICKPWKTSNEVSNGLLFLDFDFLKKEKAFENRLLAEKKLNSKGARKISKNKPVEQSKFKNDTNTSKNKNNRLEAIKTAKKLDIIINNNDYSKNLTEIQKYYADELINFALNFMYGKMKIFPSQIWYLKKSVYQKYYEYNELIEIQHNNLIEAMKCTLKYYQNHPNKQRFLPTHYFNFNSKNGIAGAWAYSHSKKREQNENIEQKIKSKKAIFDFNTNEKFKTILKELKPICDVLTFENISNQLFNKYYKYSN
jgi:hypothetical protein